MFLLLTLKFILTFLLLSSISSCLCFPAFDRKTGENGSIRRCIFAELSLLYHVTLDKLVDFDIKVKEIEEVIENTSEETQQKIDWTQMWAKKYPVLASYQQEVKTEVYTTKLQGMLTDLKHHYGYGDEDAFLVLKDILAQIYTKKGQKA